MRLIVITSEEKVADEIKIVDDLFHAGLMRLHVRKKNYSESDYRRFIEAIRPEFRSRVVTHGAFGLLSKYDLGGVHLSSFLRSDKKVVKQLAGVSPEIISTSFHSWAEVLEERVHYVYVFISPVFDSISKKGYAANLDLDGALETKRRLAANGQYCPQIIGLGGIGKEQVASLYDKGFDGAAVLGAIWNGGDPVRNYAEIRDTLNTLPGR